MVQKVAARDERGGQQAVGPGHTGSLVPYSEKPLDKGMAHSDNHFEKL